MAEHNVQKVVVASKSMAVAIILAILFGPLGMLYSTVKGGVIMLILFAIVGVLTVGIGLFVLWPICVIWAAVAANAHNNQMVQGA